MFKQLNVKKLLIAFGCLLALVVIINLCKRVGGERNFKDTLVKIDTSKVTSIVIINKGKSEIRMVRNGKSWSFTSKGKTYGITHNISQPMLAALAIMKSDHLVASGKDELAGTGCTDTAGVRVKAEINGKVVADIIVGNFKYEYPSSFVTNVRIADENEVYAVIDLMPDVLKKQDSDLRDKTLTNCSRYDITRLTFSYPGDSSFVIDNSKHYWSLNGERTDSMKVENYINALGNASGMTFVDDNIATIGPGYTLKIEGKNFKPIEIKAIATPDTSARYVITSSINPTAKFSARTGDLYSTLFKGPKEFKKADEKKRRK